MKIKIEKKKKQDTLLNLIGPTQIPHGKEKEKKRGVSLINIHYFGEQNSI
jgi:hypothetical protein